MSTISALIADDEPLLRRSLARMLQEVWPQLRIVGQAQNGREAVELYEQHRPEICFLDVQMPGMNGIEAARMIDRRAQVVFVTAFSQYAVDAFERGAIDYLVKPVEVGRLASTVQRLQDRLRGPAQIGSLDVLLDQLAAQLNLRKSTSLRWIRAGVGSVVRVIDCEHIEYLRAEDKYTTIAWHSPQGGSGEAVVRQSLGELLAQLDPDRFVQVHRAVVVNLSAISKVVRHDSSGATIHLRHREETLPVSRSRLHLFRQQ